MSGVAPVVGVDALVPPYTQNSTIVGELLRCISVAKLMLYITVFVVDTDAIVCWYPENIGTLAGLKGNPDVSEVTVCEMGMVNVFDEA